ncbi:MAG: hypothetical protein ACKN9I_06345, partial [Alphaproteobacteria bacterium]
APAPAPEPSPPLDQQGQKIPEVTPELTPQTSPEPQNGGGVNVGAIAGGTIVGALFFTFLAFAGYSANERRKKINNQDAIAVSSSRTYNAPTEISTTPNTAKAYATLVINDGSREGRSQNHGGR